MRAHLMLAAGLLCLAPAAFAGPFDDQTAVAADELDGKRGGTGTSPISGSLFQTNESDLSGSNVGSIGVGPGGAKYSGTIAPAQVMGNHGITAVMQNTGDMVNMNNATSVNIYMR
jgi:hypothetical protein